MASLNNLEKAALIDIIDKADCLESLKSALLLRTCTNNKRDVVTLLLSKFSYEEILEIVRNGVKKPIAAECVPDNLVPLEDLVL